MTLRGPNRQESGVTLLEMLIVVSIIGLVSTLVAPSVFRGLDAIRLSQASDSVATFLTRAVNRCESRQQAIEIEVSPEGQSLTALPLPDGTPDRLPIPVGIRIQRVFPELPGADQGTRRFVLIPAGGAPRIGVELASERGRRLIRLDPITGVARIDRPQGIPQ